MKFFFILVCSFLFSNSSHASRFETRCIDLIGMNNEVKCNAFIDKSLAKGKLSHNDSCLAFYYKCELYLNFRFWNLSDYYHPRRTPPNVNDTKTAVADTLIRYSKLLLETAGHHSRIYEVYLTKVYYYICAETMRSWTPENFVDFYYYTRNPEYCLEYLDRISELKNLVIDFPLINRFGFELHEANLKCQFGLIKKDELNSICDDVQIYIQNRAEIHEVARESSAFMNDFFFGYDIIHSELSNFIEYLFSVENNAGRRLIDLVSPNLLDYYLEKSIYKTYDSAWEIDPTETSRNLGMIDYKDSTEIDSDISLNISLDLEYDIPTWDTLIIHQIKSDYNENIELIEPLKLSGKGVAKLSFPLKQYFWKHTEVGNINRELKIISNRGSKRITIEANILFPKNID